MSIARRSLVAAAVTLPVQPWLKALAAQPDAGKDNLVLTLVSGSETDMLPGAG